jgi:NDP-sugar pyrophosphorylase family protein
MLEHIIFGLRQQGIERVALATGYKAESIEEYFGDGARCGVALEYFVEPHPLGSGGAVRNVCDQAPAYAQSTFIIASADVLHNADLGAAIEFHRATGAVATLICCEVDNPHEVGICEVEEDGRITAFYEKPGPGVTESRWANIALWIFEPHLVSMVEPGVFTMVEDDLFQQLLRDGAPLYAYRHRGYWLDVGTVPRYLQAQQDTLTGCFPHEAQGRVTFEYSREVAQSGQKSGNLGAHEPSLLGNNCIVDKTATLSHSVLGHDVRVEAGATLRDCVVYDGASVGAGAVLQRSVIGPKVQVPPGARLEDEMLF